MLKVLLGPDVLVNASVAGGTAPQRVVQRILEEKKHESQSTEWILGRIEAMLRAHPDFLEDAVPKQMETIRGLVTVVEEEGGHDPVNWEAGLAAAAKAAGVKRVITDHPDLVEKDDPAIEFISTEAWLLEQSMPPPPPPPAAKKEEKKDDEKKD